LRVRDDGKGIDPKLLNERGRPGHYGLRGMRERAKLMGGKPAVWSELDSGTELELRIPALGAYDTLPRLHALGILVVGRLRTEEQRKLDFYTYVQDI
jgi:signal transduction histidine kinase